MASLFTSPLPFLVALPHILDIRITLEGVTRFRCPGPIHRDVFCVDWNSSLDNRINFKTDKQQLLTTAKHPGDLKVLLCSFSSLSCKYEYFHWVVCALAFHLRCTIDFEENDLLQWKQEEIGKGTNTGLSSNWWVQSICEQSGKGIRRANTV